MSSLGSPFKIFEQMLTMVKNFKYANNLAHNALNKKHNFEGIIISLAKKLTFVNSKYNYDTDLQQLIESIVTNRNNYKYRLDQQASDVIRLASHTLQPSSRLYNACEVLMFNSMQKLPLTILLPCDFTLEQTSIICTVRSQVQTIIPIRGGNFSIGQMICPQNWTLFSGVCIDFIHVVWNKSEEILKQTFDVCEGVNASILDRTLFLSELTACSKDEDVPCDLLQLFGSPFATKFHKYLKIVYKHVHLSFLGLAV